MFQVVDGKYAVSVDWEPPLQADLPINKYKIFWSRRMQGETTIFNNLKEHKKTVQVSVYTRNSNMKLEKEKNLMV